MKRIFIIALALLTSLSTVQAQSARAVLAIRGYGNQTLTAINVSQGQPTIRDSVVAIGPSANTIVVYGGNIYVVNSGNFPNGAGASIQIINAADVLNYLANGTGTVRVQTVPVTSGLNPYDIAFVSSTKAYVSNTLDNSVSVFNPATNTLGTKIRVGKGPQGLRIANGKLYVAQSYDPATYAYDSTVTVINTLADTVLRTIQTKLNPQGFGTDNLGRLHTVCTGDYTSVTGNISVITPAADTVLATVAVGGAPSSVVFTTTNTAITSLGASAGLNRYNALTFAAVATPAINGGSGSLAIGFGDSLFVARSGRIVLYNGRTLDSLNQFTLSAGTTYYGLATATLLSTTGTPVTAHPVAQAFKLEQNYPNPFNPSTTINYSLSQVGSVTLKVYDVLGREIATLVNERKAAGSYTAIFSADRFSSGIYFYRLQSGNFVQTKKMMLVK
jgi:YVTN family beta-propeller protein